MGAKAAMAAVDHEPENVWMWNHRLLHETLDTILELAKRPPIRDELGRYALHGGLGKTISRSTVHRRLKVIQQEHHDEMVELAGTYRAQALEQLDLKSRLLLGQVERCQEAVIRAAAVGALDVHAEQIITRNVVAMTKIDERRSKLLGLDAPVEAHIEVVTYDGVAIELANMLEAGATKAKKKGKRKHKAKA